MNVKIGMNMLLWGVETSPDKIPVFEGLAAAGFDGVEIPMSGHSSADLATLASACNDLGLARTASAFVGEDTNPISPDPAIRAAALDNIMRAIDDASAIGAEILIGGIYQAHKYFTGRGATEQEWLWSAQYLRAAGEYAAGRELKLGLEVLNRFEVFLINTAADCHRMVEQVGLDNVGVHYDTHHANIEDEAPASALATIKNTINHVHLSESHRGTLGSGQVDWHGHFAALEAIDYSGWLVIEAFGTSDPELAVAANVWRNAFDSPEQLYRDGIEFIRSHIG
ncbi:sugar phosphate isomerase/epimerase [Halioglobus maricola]|uniref:Sugar phosphate isomerase/epimerase n=1 Tax=Halioglobus maricola TaxID=2601894 RepID=A0A5P9NJD0_9GAMM|nr:sugar phosphate isomerase/epimerase family protein [Halioglobus maricola]QFU75941.1 sugar phosphate isomerase/epimerase [Halioglobus maricola]